MVTRVSEPLHICVPGAWKSRKRSTSSGTRKTDRTTDTPGSNQTVEHIPQHVEKDSQDPLHARL